MDMYVDIDKNNLHVAKSTKHDFATPSESSQSCDSDGSNIKPLYYEHVQKPVNTLSQESYVV